MTTAPARLALFVAVLALVFGGAALLGGAVGPHPSPAEEAGHADPASAHGEDDGHGARRPAADAVLPGLAVAQDGFRLVLTRTIVPASDRVTLAFRLVDDEGRTVRDLDVAHEKRMHLIVVRRDGRRFQHLHPTQAADGSWRTRADLGAAGSYRVFADFTADGTQHTLGADVHVPGDYAPRATPAARTTARDDRGLTVRMKRDGDRVAFTVQRDGATIDDELEPYLGAKGHLVTLRDGDLAYLHTHPEGDELAFATELPGAGTYRHWVQFQLDGRVHTTAFTEEVTP